MKQIQISFFIIFSILFLGNYALKAQGTNCGNASPFCSNDPTYTFPAATSVPSLGTIGCLYTTPNPAWYWMQIGNSGPLNIHMSSNSTNGTPHDVDFICWGPFPSLAAACATSLTSNPGVDCSYSAAAQEDCTIPNAVTGQVYVLLITNYANVPTNISFSQTSGVGSTNCGIMTPPPIGDTVCAGETAVLLVSSPVAGASYSWEGPNDFLLTTTNNSISFPNATSAVAGEYSLSITYDGRVGDPVYCRLVVNSKPTLTVTTDTICVGDVATISVSGGDTYRWNTMQTTQSISVTPLETTQYSVTGTSIWGCKDSVSTEVVVYNNPAPVVTPATICSDELATVFALNVASYVWSDPALVNDSVIPSVTASQTYIVTVTNSGGCTGTATLTVNPNPIVVATATEICQGQSSNVTANGATTYDWSNLQNGSVISVSPSTSLTLSVVGFTEFGCKGYDTVLVIVHPTPDAGFAVSSELITIDEGVISFIDQSTDATAWQYNFGEFNNPLNTSTEQNPIHIYESTGFFKIWQVVSTEFGCMDSTFKRVQVMAPYFFWVPTAFSPDNDGINESFCPKGKGIDPINYSMQIFDRWGYLVFKTNVPLECWDGFINGTKAPVGNYIYKINLKDQEAHTHEYMGQFVIIR